MPNYRIGIELEADDNASGNINKVTSAADSLNKTATKGAGGVGGLGGAIGGLLTPAGLAAGALTAVGGAVIATGAHALGLASEVEGATAKMTAQLDLSKGEAAAFEETMRAIYRNNFGEGYEDIAAALTSVESGFQRIGGLAPDELQSVTEKAFALRDAFEYDIDETVGATATLMEQFGLTSSEAMDFIAAATQRGLNSSGDLLDTIGEYGSQFGEGGATAEEFFGILEAGNAGGVLGTDKAADAFKEFNIRIKDDSESTKEALDGIGINYETLRQGFADGSITTVGAMQTVIAKINEIEDPIERNKLGVALFGTQWEDLGETVVSELGDVDLAMEDTEGAMESLNEQYDTNMSDIEEATRLWNDALADVGGAMAELGAETLPWLSEQVTTHIVPAIKDLAEFFRLLGEGKGISWDWGDGPSWWPGNSDPAAGGSSLPAMTPATVGASSMGGSQIYQNFYIERGDYETVVEAGQVGIGQAQRVRGS